MYQICKAYYQKCTDTKSDIHIALLQIRSTLLGPGLQSPATLLFNHPIRGTMPIINRLPISTYKDDDDDDDDDDHNETSVKRQACQDNTGHSQTIPWGSVKDI